VLSVSNTYHGGGAARYTKVRAGFISTGSSLHAWCRENRVAMPNVRAAFLGKWNGPKAQALIERVSRAAGGEVA
jgi:hypothetical protein